LIEQLDTPGRPGGNMFIVYLKNAEAARVAQTLRALLTGGDGGGTAPPGCWRRCLSGDDGRLDIQHRNAGAATTPLATGAPASAALSFSANGATITADVASNALVIMAPEPVYNNLERSSKSLDFRRAQGSSKR